MRELVASLLGEYLPQSEDGVILQGLASIDWVWITGAVIFCIAFAGFFMLVRTLLRALLNLR